MLLFIDTSDFESAALALVNQQIVWHKFTSRNLSEQLLVEIKKFLKKQKLELKDLTKLAVIIGPGGFSRIRTAVATANALGFSLDIPIVGLEKPNQPADLKKLLVSPSQKMFQPAYGKEPNITLAKKG